MKKNFIGILIAILGGVGPIQAEDQEGIPFPQDDPAFYFTLPDDWYLDSEDPEAWDMRPQKAVGKTTPALEDHAIVKLNVVASEEDAATLTWDDVKDALTNIIGSSAKGLSFKKPEFVKAGPFSYGHLSAQGTYLQNPGKGKPLYADLYAFRPEGAQVTRLNDLFSLGNGRLYLLVFFTRDASEDQWGSEMDTIFDSISLTAPRN